MSSYSPNLRIELITTGDQVGTWGSTTNTNLGTLLEDAISGYTSVSVTTANQALTANNGSADQSRNASIALTTTTTAAFAVYAPPAEKTYTVYNASSYTATIYNSTVLGNTTAAGTGVAIPAGKTVTVWSDGTNFAFQNNHLSSLTLATDLAVTEGGTGASTAADARTNLGLGTMATQNSNSVTITGGSITGITDLAVADGGTGASTAADARTNLSAAKLGANSDITSLAGLTTALSVAQGGTGTTTSTGSGSVVLSASPTMTGTPLAPTATYGTSTTQLATTAFVQAALQALHPVGSIYINATNSTNPGTLLGFGTWAAFGAGRVPVGFDSGNALFNTAEETGGSADAITVSHTHTGTTDSDGSHQHYTVANETQTSNISPSSSNYVAKNSLVGGETYERYFLKGTSTAATEGLTSSSGTHTHSFTTGSTGSSGTNANYQPYITVYMWKRTA